jgi:hypothetical protein
MMVEFKDWLIKTKRPAIKLQFTGEDVSTRLAGMVVPALEIGGRRLPTASRVIVASTSAGKSS